MKPFACYVLLKQCWVSPSLSRNREASKCRAVCSLRIQIIPCLSRNTRRPQRFHEKKGIWVIEVQPWVLKVLWRSESKKSLDRYLSSTRILARQKDWQTKPINSVIIYALRHIGRGTGAPQNKSSRKCIRTQIWNTPRSLVDLTLSLNRLAYDPYRERMLNLVAHI